MRALARDSEEFSSLVDIFRDIEKRKKTDRVSDIIEFSSQKLSWGQTL